MIAATHVALLRGVNVGGRHKLPMAEVRRVLDQASLGPVRTYIQSGNVVLRGDEELPRLAARVQELLERSAGFPVPVVLVPASRWRAVLADNPFQPAEPKLEHVVFLNAPPADAVMARLEALRHELSGADDVAFGDHCVYLNHPEGLLQSRLAEKAMALLKDGTARNLATVRRVAELLD